MKQTEVSRAATRLDSPARPQDDTASEPDFLVPGTAEFGLVSRALIAVGLATFAVLYCVQPLQPMFSREFGVSPAESSLTLSLTTLLLAPMLIVASSISDAVGRKSLMIFCMLASAILTMAAAFAPNWHSLLALRLLEGITLSGLQAVAMAYVGEEVALSAVGFAMGLFVSGSSLGGLSGRLVAGLVNGAFSWRAALAVTASLAFASGLYVWRVMPASRHFYPRPLNLRSSLLGLQVHLSKPALRILFMIGLLNMGAFVSAYSLIGYRLLEAPYLLNPAVVSSIFVMYLIGSVSSAWMGGIADRWGRKPALAMCLALALIGILTTAAEALPVVVAGLGCFTFGFFGVHSILSGWVSYYAQTNRAQASALYLFSFYIGSSVVASSVALVWPRTGWTGVSLSIAGMLLVAMLLTSRLMQPTGIDHDGPPSNAIAQ